MSANQEQIDYWNGVGGLRWATHQEALDRMVRPFGLAAMERLKLNPGEAVLDVGCGCGDSTGALAALVAPGGTAVGIDISGPMLSRARQLRPALQFIQADVVEHPFERSFDAVFSRFGVMFFADPVLAFRRLHALLSASAVGRIAFACWRADDENSWHTLPVAAVRAALPNAPIGVQDRGAGPGPFAFADPELVTSVLRDAGFAQIALEPFEAEVWLSDEGLLAAAQFALTVGPAARLLIDASPEERERATEAVRAALAPHLANGRVTLRGAAWIVTARAT